MTGTQIQYFFAVYRHGNIAKAADSLHVSRPVVSRALSELEKSLEIKLFDRTSGGILPTKRGVALYNMLDCFAKTYDYTIEKLKNPDFSSETRELRVGVLNAGGSWFYPMIYRPFRETHPDIAVRIAGVQVEDAVERIISGSLDMAIAPILGDTMLLGSLYLFTTQWVLCAPKGSFGDTEISLSECANLPMAVLETLPPPFYEYRSIELSTKDPELIRVSIAEGYANAVLPLELCENWDDVDVVPLAPPQTPRIFLFWNKAVPHGSAFDAFLSFVKNIDFEKLGKSR